MGWMWISVFSPRLLQCLAIGKKVLVFLIMQWQVCFLVCTVPPFLPLNFHPRLYPQWKLFSSPPACSLHICAGTETPFPLESNNASIRFCTEWCQPRGLACNRPLLQTEAHIHWIHSQLCSTRWMASRDTPGPNHLLQLGDSPKALEKTGRDWELLRPFCCFIVSLPLAAMCVFKFWIVNTLFCLSQNVLILLCCFLCIFFCEGLAACYAPSDNG